MFRRDAACEIIRSGTSSSTPTTRAASPARAQPVADGAEQRHSRSTDTSANSSSASTIASRCRAIVDRHRHADLRRRHHVHGGAEALEHLEHLPQEPVRHQHPARGDVDDGDIALRREAGETGAVERPVGGDQRAGSPPASASSESEPGCCARRPAGSCSDAAPWRRSTPAPPPRQTRAAARGAALDDARIGGQHAVDVGPDLDLRRTMPAPTSAPE